MNAYLCIIDQFLMMTVVEYKVWWVKKFSLQFAYYYLQVILNFFISSRANSKWNRSSNNEIWVWKIIVRFVRSCSVLDFFFT